MIMPKLNGREAFNLMKKINPDIKSLIASGYSSGEDIQGVMSEGATAFIEKPYERSKLSQIISKILT
jgi:two-component system, cell cycle sensor histidine kinase and response regulator CckA